MKVNNSDNQNKINKSLLTATTITGAVTGGIYAKNHLSEENVKKLADINARSPQWLENFADSFNTEKAMTSLKNEEISQEAYDVFKNTHESILNTINAEKFVNTVADTQFEKRTTTYAEATAKARSAHFAMHKSLIKFNTKLMGQLNELGIFDKAKFDGVIVQQKQKLKEVLKVMRKPIGVGIAAGAAVGVIIGAGIDRLFKGTKKD